MRKIGPIAKGLALLAVAFTAGATGCAAPAPQGVDLHQANRSDWLFPEDLQEIRNYTVIEAIRQLRPRWLRARGPEIQIGPDGALSIERGVQRVRAYVDEVQSSLDRLEVIAVDDVLRIHYLTAPEATMRFGIDHEGGAIMVTTRGG